MRRPRAGDERASQSTRAARGPPPGGHYEPPAGRWLRGAAVTACPQTASRKAQPGAASSVYDCGRSGMKTTANEPGHRKMSGWRAGRRFRIFARRCGYSTDYGSAPWRAVPSHPEGRGDKGKTGLPGASINNTGDGARLRKISRLKSESVQPRLTNACRFAAEM